MRLAGAAPCSLGTLMILVVVIVLIASILAYPAIGIFPFGPEKP